ncbi:hypothetical protein M405DRAFT_814111, partial [Rhizopogon salebrosus TDB-379]
MLDAIMHGQQCLGRRSIYLQLIVRLEQCGMMFPGEKSLYFDPTIFDLCYWAFARRSKENLLVNLLNRVEEGAWMEVLALGEYARR